MKKQLLEALRKYCEQVSHNRLVGDPYAFADALSDFIRCLPDDEPYDEAHRKHMELAEKHGHCVPKEYHESGCMCEICKKVEEEYYAGFRREQDDKHEDGCMCEKCETRGRPLYDIIGEQDDKPPIDVKQIQAWFVVNGCTPPGKLAEAFVEAFKGRKVSDK